MRVLNIHKRVINEPKIKIAKLLETLSTENDMIMPTDKWPKMKLSDGLKLGSKGGHGPIKYTVNNYVPGELIQFEFTAPKGFEGVHRFEITELNDAETELKHTIDMNAIGIGIMTWTIAIRWLHDALMEDAFDKVENHFNSMPKRTEWNYWVKFLRKMLK